MKTLKTTDGTQRHIYLSVCIVSALVYEWFHFFFQICLFSFFLKNSFADVTSIVCLLCKAVTNHTYRRKKKKKTIGKKNKDTSNRTTISKASGTTSITNRKTRLHNGIQRKYVCLCVCSEWDELLYWISRRPRRLVMRLFFFLISICVSVLLSVWFIKSIQCGWQTLDISHQQ